MRYISLFSGAGGLEHARVKPALLCEIDDACRAVLARRFPASDLAVDVTRLDPPRGMDAVAGGWPCQDLSIAGTQKGLAGARSGLFYDMLRVAERSGAHTVVAENVPNLLRIGGGATFEIVVKSLVDAGYRTIAWRMLNARHFGLPHHRARLFLVASRHAEVALRLHRPIPKRRKIEPVSDTACNAYYWTAGTQSICYSEGFSPTLKVGSALKISSPPAVHFADVTRKMTPDECLKLQGFKPGSFRHVTPADRYRIAGNAVAVPVGRFVMKCLDDLRVPRVASSGRIAFGPDMKCGLYLADEARSWFEVREPEAPPLAANLADVIDLDDRSTLSERAASGLLRRLRRAGKDCPPDLLALLERVGCVAAEPPVERLRATEDLPLLGDPG